MLKQETPKTTCRHCQGSGKTDLPEHLEVTWRYVVNHPGSTVEQVHKGSRVNGGVTLTNNRLRDLLEMKLVKRDRHGKVFHYTAARKSR
jgi:hypothetical protein